MITEMDDDPTGQAWASLFPGLADNFAGSPKNRRLTVTDSDQKPVFE
jgi:hypothetical protein